MNVDEGLKLVGSVKCVSRETQERLTVFYKLLCQWQQKINLISPKTIDQIWERHIADSMQCVTASPGPKHLVDIGSGAGFPGMILAIAMAEEAEGTVEFIESNGKKCAFLNAVIRETGLQQTGLKIRVHQGRIEDIIPTLEIPNLITARALASLNDLLSMTEPLLKNQCVGLFPKGRDHLTEIEQAEKKWSFSIETVPSIFEADSVLLKISNVYPR